MALHQRLLRDIAELQANPYPNITLFPSEDITSACLILTPNGETPLHLKVNFGSTYPLVAPKVTIQSDVIHPNVFDWYDSGDKYICATILNTDEGYTPAYTMKGVAIQLLSFFSSDTLEQDHGGGAIDIASYRERRSYRSSCKSNYKCDKCGFDSSIVVPAVDSMTQFPALNNSAQRELVPQVKTVSSISHGQAFNTDTPTRIEHHVNSFRQIACSRNMTRPLLPLAPIRTLRTAKKSTSGRTVRKCVQLTTLPDEILILICEALETEELMAFARATNRVGGEDGIMTKYDLIRTRELQCFCLKKSFASLKLGVGVIVTMRGRQGTLESEFDLLSQQAFKDFKVRRSVQGLPFTHWLPLPISRRHYDSVKAEVKESLLNLGKAAKLASVTPAAVIYSFMNDVVVKLSEQASKSFTRRAYPYSTDDAPKSTLKHASEKAIESYFSLFHLLCCLATSDDEIVRSANRLLAGFLQGQTSKTVCPNLGHLLIAVLISDLEMTPNLTMAIIKETITRNVVWMLDAKGAGMAELSYMEADPVSHYRLQKTFEASKTSYRLLMFLNIFRLAKGRGAGAERKTLVQLRDEIFDAHGAPPRGAAAKLAGEIKRLQAVENFPDFLAVMGVEKTVTAGQFTVLLRRSVIESVQAGYSKWGVSQAKALEWRRVKEPGVGVREAKDVMREWTPKKGGGGGFFPAKR